MEGKMYKFGHIAIAAFLILLFAILSVRNNLSYYILAVEISFLLIRFWRKRQCLLSKAAVWAITFVTRYGFSMFMDGKILQISDMGIVLEVASGANYSDHLEYYIHYAHKLIYPMLLHALHLRSQAAIYLFQSVILAFCAVLIYSIAEDIHENSGTYAAALYILWPAQLIYSDITTEDHLAALVTLLIIRFLFLLAAELEHGLELREDLIRYMLIAVFAGLLFGFSQFFKDWGSIIIVAAIFAAILLLIRYQDARRRIMLVLTFVVIIVIRSMISSAVIGYAEQKLESPLGNNVVVAQMYSTLDPNSSGEYNAEGNEEYFALIEENNYDFSKANRQALGILWSRIISEPQKMPGLLLGKASRAYIDDTGMLYYSIVEGLRNYEFYDSYHADIQIIWYVSILYYAIMVCLTIFGGLCNASPKKTFIMMCILGAIMASSLMESQGRYKYSIEPLWCTIAGGCFVVVNKTPHRQKFKR